ncbi:MAG TPA: DMT family transporter [Ramlibacter sp.]|jgi:drug/metabolite transporter (DMT)-like permease
MSSLSRQDALVRAMPAIFVVIWSTGFIVARYGMPHAPPMKFLALRYFLSVACFVAWATAAGVALLPRERGQVKHLAVTGILMHAGYLGGVWAAVKLGMGAGLAALLVGLQPVLTAVWVSSRGGVVSARQWAGLALGFGGLALVVWQKLGVGEISGANFLLAVGALLSITAGTIYQKRFLAPCDVRTASLVQLCAAFAVTLPLAVLETESMRWNGELAGAMAWSVLALTLGGSSLLYLLIHRGAATAVSSLMYLVPPCTAMLAWLLFGEAITLLTITGIALAALGVSLVVRQPSPQRA